MADFSGFLFLCKVPMSHPQEETFDLWIEMIKQSLIFCKVWRRYPQGLARGREQLSRESPVWGGYFHPGATYSTTLLLTFNWVLTWFLPIQVHQHVSRVESEQLSGCTGWSRVSPSSPSCRPLLLLQPSIQQTWGGAQLLHYWNNFTKLANVLSHCLKQDHHRWRYITVDHLIIEVHV